MDVFSSLLPKIEQFTEPSKILLVDFWSTSEQTRGQGEVVANAIPVMIMQGRDNIHHLPVQCTEEDIFQLPAKLLQSDADGIVLLPPLNFDQGTRAILDSLLTRRQLTRSTTVEPDNATNWWQDIPFQLVKQRDLSAFIVGMVVNCIGNDSSLNIFSHKSILSGGRSGRLRDMLQHSAKLRLVLECGSCLAVGRRAMEFAWLSFDVSDDEDQMVRCFKIPNESEADSSKIFQDFSQLQKQDGGKTSFGYVNRSGLPERGSWLVEAHHPRWEAYLDELAAVGEVTRLPELGELDLCRVGPSVLTRDETPFPTLDPLQIRADGTIDFDDRERTRFLKNDEYAGHLALQTGDVLVRKLQSFAGGDSPLRIAVYPTSGAKHYLSTNTIRFRFNADVDHDVRQFVIAYLSSSEAARWLSSRADGVHVHIDRLRELPIPVPAHDVLTSFKRMRKTKQQFTDWAEQLNGIESRLFKFETLRDAQREMLEVGARAEQKVAAASSVDTLTYRVRNLYPHPVAFRWRTAEILQGGLEKYSELLEAVEVAIAYAAIVGCAMSEVFDGKSPGYVENIASKLIKRPGTGIALGDWLSIFTEVNQNSKYRKIEDDAPFSEITKVFERYEGITDTIDALNLKRNAKSHGRGPDEDELEKSIVSTSAETESLFEALDCLSRYPLRDIISTHPTGRRKSGTYVCKELVGDHPVPPTLTVPFDGDTPACGLHIVDQHGKPHFVEPWIVRRRCGKCRHEETYILDRYLKAKSISLKSLEYGHEQCGDDLRIDFQEVGINLPGN
jgi:hypothetical protein